MTLILDRAAKELRDSDGTVIGSVSGPPYTIPDDAVDAVESQFPNDNASVSVEELRWFVKAYSGDVEWADSGT